MAGYVFCGESDGSLHNPVVVTQFVFTLSQLVIGVFSAYYLYRRLVVVVDNRESRSTFYLHCGYVAVFFILWLFQVSLFSLFFHSLSTFC